jgi:hypothetical protein
VQRLRVGHPSGSNNVDGFAKLRMQVRRATGHKGIRTQLQIQQPMNVGFLKKIACFIDGDTVWQSCRSTVRSQHR